MKVLNNVKSFMILLGVMSLSIYTYAVEIELNGTMTKVHSEDGNDSNITCHEGDIYRFPNKTKFHGVAFDILVKIGDEKNDVNQRIVIVGREDNGEPIYIPTPCIEIDKVKVENNHTRVAIGFYLRNKTNKTPHQSSRPQESYIDVEFIPIKKSAQVGHELDPENRIDVEQLQFTALDLDRFTWINPFTGELNVETGRDTVFLGKPGEASLLPDSKLHLENVNDLTGFNHGDYTKIIGHDTDCKDYLHDKDETCRGHGIIKTTATEKSMRLRLYNRNANDYRLIQIALSSALVPSLVKLEDDTATGNYGHSVTIDIILNDDPSVVADTISLIVPVGLTATATDTNGDGDSDKIVVPGEGIWIVDNTGKLTFTPEGNFYGSPTPITYTAKDGNGYTLDPASVIVIYNSGNSGPRL